MKFCPNCGEKLKEGAKFCPKCGSEIKTGKPANSSSKGNDKLMAVLSYLGFLALIPFFVRKDDKFIMFHAKQGLNLLIMEAIYSVVSVILTSVIRVKHSFGSFYGYDLGYHYATPGWLYAILYIVSTGFLVLSIIGIVNAANGKEKELPIINKIKFIK